MTDGHSGVPRRVWLLLGVMVFVWSFNFIVAKSALKEFPPLLLGSLRFTVAGLLILPVFLWKRRGPIDWKAAPALVGIGLMGVGFNQLLFLAGLVRTSVAHSALIIAMTPVWVLLLSSWMGHDRVSRGKIVGLGMSILGIAVLQLRSPGGAEASLVGDLFVALTGITFAFFAVGGKSLRGRYDSLTLTAFSYAGSAVVLAPITLWQASGFAFGVVTAQGWLAVLYMAVFPSLVAYAIYYHALRYMSASRISMLAYVQPFLATLFAVPLLGEKITSPVLAGGAMVLIGVWWTERH